MAKAAGRAGLCLHPLGHRRPQPPGLLRDPCRRTAITAIAFWRRARAFFASYGITVERVITDNGPCYRAKVFTAELVAAGIKHTGSPALPAPDQRQGRALQPDPPKRVGLRPPLPLRSRQNPSSGHLAPHVQPSSAPHRHRGTTRQPCQQPGWAEQLAQGRQFEDRDVVVVENADPTGSGIEGFGQFLNLVGQEQSVRRTVLLHGIQRVRDRPARSACRFSSHLPQSPA